MEIDDRLLIEFLNGTCDADGLRAVKGWLDADPAHADALFRLESVHCHVAAASMNAREVSQHLRNVHRRIDAGSLKTHREVRLRALLLRVAVVAGIVFLGTLAWWLAGSGSPLRASKMLVATASGSNPRLVRLADGTSVWLRAGSMLRYPAAFGTGERRVELHGEGYFEVTKDSRRPFIVVGGPVDVKVLGTKFDFAVSRERQLANVSLIEGSVEVRDVRRDARMLLKPNQRLHINTLTGRQNMEMMDTRIVAAWHDRLIPFTNANINTIARTIEQLYGVEVHVADNVDNAETYSGAVYLASNIDSVLRLVQSTVPIKYHRRGNAVWLYKE